MSDTQKRDAVQREFYAPYYKSEYDESALPLEEVDVLVIDSMIDEIVRLRAILAALREPSKEVFGAALRAYSESLSVTHKPRFISAILAAVAAAEQEVGRD